MKKLTDLEQDELLRKYQEKIDKDIARMNRRGDMPKDVEKQIRKQLLDLYVFQEKDKEREIKSKRDSEKKLQNFLKKHAKNAEISQKNAQILSKNENQIVYTVNQENEENKKKIDEFQREFYYQKSDWKTLSLKKREQNLEKNKGLCEMCLQDKAAEVHHVVKFFNQDTEELRNKLLLDDDNLVCLCAKCHHKVHGDQRKLFPYERIWLENKKNYLTDKYLKQGEIINVSDIVLR